MTDLRKPQGQLIYDLIEEANPGFKDDFDASDYVIDKITAITPGSGDYRDTRVLLRPSASAGNKMLGNRQMTYRRVDLSKLFRNISVRIDTYTAATQLPMEEAIAAINAKYGVSLRAEDYDLTAISQGNSNLTTRSTSLCYKGLLVVNWTKGKQDLDAAMIAGNNGSHRLVGRLWPGGNDFEDPERKPQGELYTYGADLTAQAAALNSIGTSGTVAVGATWAQNATALINQQMGEDVLSADAATEQGGIGGLPFTRVTLPNASYPDANSAKFNRMLVIAAAADSWFQGKLYFHYNG